MITNSSDDHVSHLRPAQVQRTGTRVIEKPIHCKEGLTGSSARWKVTTYWKTSVEAPREEDWPAYWMIMR